MHPGAQKATLNTSCEVMKISIAERVVHGALIDARLCAELFLALISKEKDKEKVSKVELYEKLMEKAEMAEKVKDESLVKYNKELKEVAKKIEGININS